MYLRSDIYYCPGCGQFFSEVTDQLVEVPLHEMPADFALQVMKDRQKSFSCHAPRSTKRRPKPKRGFSR